MWEPIATQVLCDEFQAILATEEVAEWRTAEVVARSLSEYVSIVAAASLFTFGHITGMQSSLSRSDRQKAHCCKTSGSVNVKWRAPACLLLSAPPAAVTYRIFHKESDTRISHAISAD